MKTEHVIKITITVETPDVDVPTPVDEYADVTAMTPAHQRAFMKIPNERLRDEYLEMWERFQEAELDA